MFNERSNTLPRDIGIKIQAVEDKLQAEVWVGVGVTVARQTKHGGVTGKQNRLPIQLAVLQANK
jgi:hypothetical protein